MCVRWTYKGFDIINRHGSTIKIFVICSVVAAGNTRTDIHDRPLFIHFMHCVRGTMCNNLGLENRITLRAAVFLFIKHNLLAAILLVIAWQG